MSTDWPRSVVGLMLLYPIYTATNACPSLDVGARHQHPCTRSLHSSVSRLASVLWPNLSRPCVPNFYLALPTTHKIKPELQPMKNASSEHRKRINQAP